MTPEENMQQILKQISRALLNISPNICYLARETGISQQALTRIIRGGNKTGCSLSNLVAAANYTNKRLELTPLSPDSSGVLLDETTITQTSH